MVSLERAKRLLKSKETQKEYEMLKTPVAKFTPVEALKPEAVIAPDVSKITAREALAMPMPSLAERTRFAQQASGQAPMPKPLSMNLGDNATIGGYLANRAISGLTGVTEGLEATQNLLRGQDKSGLPPTELQLQQQRLKEQRLADRLAIAEAGESMPKAARFVGDITEAGTGMLPTIALSAASGGVMGIPFIMTSATGNSYEQARREGADHGQALKYGIASGLIEGAIEGIIGGIPGMKGVADPLIDTATKGIKSKLMKEVAKYGLNALGEGVEEALASAIDPLLRRGTFDETAKADLNEILHSFLVGTATSALMQAPSSLAGIRSTKVKTNPIQQVMQNVQQEVMSELQDALTGDFQQDTQQFTPIGGEPISQPLELPDLPVRYNPNLKNEASNKGDHIEVGDKFYQLSPEQQETILVHENAHNIADEYLFKQRHFEEIMNNKAFGETKTAPNGRTYWEGIFGDVGANSVVETFTEAIAVYKGNPQWLQERHPQAYEYIKNNVVEGLSAQQGFTPIGGEYAAASIETPALTVQMPTEQTQARIFGEPEIPKGQRERGFIRNIRTDEARPEPLRQTFSERTETYIQAFGKETVGKAQRVFNEGLEPAITKLYDLVEKIKPEAAPLSKMIADELTIQGQVDRAREIVSTVASRMTEAGQFTQAARLLRQADAATFLMTINKQIAKLNEQGRKRYGKKWTDVDLTADEKAAIEQIQPGDQEAYDSAMEQIRNRLANEMPSDAMEKFDAWRRIAMLLNPKTHIRNIGGNVIMMGMRKTADTIGAGLEVITDEIRKAAGKEPMERTKSVGWSFDKGRVDTVNKSWETVKKDLEGISRWKTDIVSALGKEKRTFETGFLQWLNDVSFKTLNLEDSVFTERAYKDALGQYLKANKLTEVNDSAVEYSTRRALEATYRQNNKVADAINNLKRTRGAGKLLEAAIPFTKTPANIAKTAFEYSPLGLSKTLFQSDKSPAAIIETISKGMTGTGIFGLGMLLKALGWAKGGKKRSEKSEALEQVSGIQQYSIITPQGSFTLDWAQPFAIPFFMGVSLMEKLEQQEDFDYDAFMDAAAAGGDTFFNMTMLQNVKRLLGGAGSTSEAILGLPWNYVQQAWPAVFGQAARTIDDIRRSTYDPDGWKQMGNIIQSKIPYIGIDWLPSSKKLEPALDVWGQEQSQGGVIQQFISPGYWREATSDPVTQETVRLFDAFRDTDMLPKVAPKSFSADNVKYTLSAEQRTQFQRDMGQANYSDLARLINSAEYQRLTDAQKVKRIKGIINDNYNDMKDAIIKASALKGN